MSSRVPPNPRRSRPRRLTFALLLAAVVAGGAVAAAYQVRTQGHTTDGHTSAAHDPGSVSPSGSASPRVDPPTPTPIPGYLLIADRGNDRTLLVGSGKRILWRYPRPGVAPAMPFNYDDDVFFGRDFTRIISQQEEQHTIQVLSFPAGRLLWHYGHVDVRGSSPGYLNTPDDAYLLANGVRTVADVYNCRVIFISPAGRIVRQIGTTGVCGHDPPRLLSQPNGDTPLPNGGTLVTEITGSWLDAIGPRGNLLWAVRAPVRYPSDAQWLGHGRILLADYSRPGHVLVMTTTGHVLWEYGPASGPGMLDHPSLAIRLPNGLIALNDDYRHRIVLIDPRTNRIVWQYGHTDAAGTAPGYLNTPDGMDFLPFDVAMHRPGLRRLVLPR